MSFFDELPQPDAAEQRRYVDPPWRRVPHEALPVSLSATQVLHRTDETALILERVSVYPSGIEFTVLATRHPELGPSEQPMHEALHGNSTGTGDSLRVGLLHDDGTRATFPPGPGGHPGRSSDPPSAFLSTAGGGGTNDMASFGLWAWPIPALGDLTLVFRWRNQGLDETRVVLSGDELRAAAAACVEIWPGAQSPMPTNDDEEDLWS